MENTRRTLWMKLCMLCSASLVMLWTSCGSLRAEEGGLGHYLPGGIATIVDFPPPKPGWNVGAQFLYYDANVSASRQILVGGIARTGLAATAYSGIGLAFYTLRQEVFGSHYTFGAAVPYTWLDVSAQASVLGRTRRIRDTANGFGDFLLFPLMMNWSKREWQFSFMLPVFVPTGDYTKGQLANLGRNYFTSEPTIGVNYISHKFGTEFTSFAAFDLNTMNDATDYQSGSVFHLEYTLAQHLPVFGRGLLGIGGNGFYYQQITGDTGSGARLGSFEGRTVGIGPSVNFIYQSDKLTVAVEAKWLPEIDTVNRLQGDIVWFKVGVSF